MVWFFRSYAIPLLFLPVPLSKWTAVSFAFWFGAEPVKARVTLLKESDHGRLDGTLYYEYVDPTGVLRTGSTGLRTNELERWRADLAGRVRERPAPGEPDLRPEVWVRAMDVGPIHYSKAMSGEVIYWCGTPPASCILALMCVGWFIASAGVFVGAYHAPWSERRLMRQGVAVPGRIVGRGGDGPPRSPFGVEYEFEVRPGVVAAGKMTVNSEHKDRTVPGAAVTVLYHPRRPTRSIVYEFADFHEVVP